MPDTSRSARRDERRRSRQSPGRSSASPGRGRRKSTLFHRRRMISSVSMISLRHSLRHRKTNGAMKHGGQWSRELPAIFYAGNSAERSALLPALYAVQYSQGSPRHLQDSAGKGTGRQGGIYRACRCGSRRSALRIRGEPRNRAGFHLPRDSGRGSRCKVTKRRGEET